MKGQLGLVITPHHEGIMNVSASDPTIRSLRLALDRHYAAVMESGGGVSNGLVGVILDCLPPDIFNCIFLPADVARGPHLAITFKPEFRGYVTFAAEYWADLFLGQRMRDLTPEELEKACERAKVLGLA